MKLCSQQFLSTFASLARLQMPAGGEPADDARQLAQKLGPQATISLAQQAALLMVDQAEEQTEARVHDEYLRAKPAGEQVLGPWRQLQAIAGTDLPEPRISDSPALDLGAQAGNQVFLEESALQSQLSDPAELTFLMAHEMGHVVHRDSVRRAGSKLAVALFSPALEGLGEAQQQNARRMELEADEFAAGLMKPMNCDSRPILARLLNTSTGHDHPDGLARAEVVRGYLPVADETWQELLQKTSKSRAASQAFEEEQIQLRQMMLLMR